MSNAVGGSLESVGLDSREFVVAADADATRDLGGFTNAVEPNGDGSARLLKTRKTWKVGGLALEINTARGDQEYLQGLADRKDFFPITVTHADGSTYGGKGQISGDLGASTAKATGTIELSGPKKLEPQ